MSELIKIKKNVSKIVTGQMDGFTVDFTEHIAGDVWKTKIRSDTTKRTYSFKDDGFNFYDFKQENDKEKA